MNDHLKIFQSHRGLLFSIGYRMMGSADDAEDLLQDAYLKFTRQDLTLIRNPRALLVTILTRLAIDQKRSAYERKRSYPGPWLPEPMIDGFEESLALADTASAAFLLVLERLSPVERAVFLLRDVFDFDYSEIAGIVRKREDYCRKIAQRSREAAKAQNKHYAMPEKRKKELLTSFQIACAAGDLKSLVQLLTEDVQMYTDSGGKIVAARKVVFGALNVSKFFVGLSSKAGGWFSVPVQIGRDPGLILFESDGTINSVSQFEFNEDKLHRFYGVRNPEKLRRIQAWIRRSPRLRLKVFFYKWVARAMHLRYGRRMQGNPAAGIRRGDNDFSTGKPFARHRDPNKFQD
ncbi:MAG: RNA polymerase sigma factor SigJ [Leptospiraceae bacterium]|nr:RNA polymerase sigma factor SigJ [Leptospiraceae bacterium]